MKFEYKIITVSKAHLSKEGFQTELSTKFNLWGHDGWELIKVESVIEGSGAFGSVNTTDFLMIFKKQLS